MVHPGSAATRLALTLTIAAVFSLPSLGCDFEGLLASAKERLSASSETTGEDEVSASVADGNSLGPDAAKRLYYQFVDERGSVRFVERLDDVPQQWRASVGFVEMDGPPPLSPADAKRARDARFASRGSGLTPSKAGGGGSFPDLVMYTADWCGWCKKAKVYLDDKRVPYTERDVDNPAAMAELVEKTGQKGIPVFDLDGKILSGFDPGRLDRMLRDAA